VSGLARPTRHHNSSDESARHRAHVQALRWGASATPANVSGLARPTRHR